MRWAVANVWNAVMDSRYNPLSNIPDTNTRHLVMQILAWMWCIIFSFWLGSIVVFGISAMVHTLLLAGVAITASTFEVARRSPAYFGPLGRSTNGEHN